MGKSLSNLERQILSVIQYGMPMSLSPYQDLAGRIGIPTEQLIEILQQWKAEGRIRRLGAIVNHFEMGHGTGAMVVWNVPEKRIEGVGTLFTSFSKVSHAYQRPSRKQWPYNLYTMVHATRTGELAATIRAMSDQSGLTEFRELKTLEELKKTPPVYITEE